MPPWQLEHEFTFLKNMRTLGWKDNVKSGLGPLSLQEAYSHSKTCRISTDNISLNAKCTIKNDKMLEETMWHQLESDKTNGKLYTSTLELSERDYITDWNKIEP